MNNNNEPGGFSYTYSAREQAELKRIREKYLPHTEEVDKLEQLRRLDASTTRGGATVAIILGVFGSLIMGIGMSLCMTDLSTYFGIPHGTEILIGAAIGIVGMILISLAYPVYRAIVNHRRKKLAPEILRLTEDLLK